MSTAPRRRPGWQSAILQDLVFFQRGYDITKAEQKPGNIPVVSSSGVNSYHSEAKVDGPGVVIGRKGSLGTVHYVDGPYWPHDTTLWSRDFKGNLPRFVFYFLQTLGLERYDVGNSNPTLNRNHIHRLDILLPEYQIQERIVEVLSAYDDLIENNRRRIQLLEEAARLLYREWFVHLRFPGHEHVAIKDGVPEGWEKKTAYDVMDVLSGGTPKTKVQDYWDGDIPFYTPKDAVDYAYVGNTEKTLTEEGLRNCNSKLYPKDTVFITARGTVGKINITQTAMAMNQSCYALVAKPPINQYFLYYSLVNGVEQFRSRAVGAVFNAIIRDTFKQIPFVVPDVKLIQAFTGHVTPLLQQMCILSTETQKLIQARDLLLPRLMNGEIAV